MAQFNVFLSYNESDLALIERIKNILNRIQISVYSYTHYPEYAISDLIYRLRYLCNSTSIQLKCTNKNCRQHFVVAIPNEMEISEAIKNNEVFFETCPFCENQVSYSPKTFEQV